MLAQRLYEAGYITFDEALRNAESKNDMRLRIKLESNRQLSSYKSKYSEYKQKLRKANQNIATLLTRLAKFDIQMQAERDDGPRTDGLGGIGSSEPRSSNNIAKWAYSNQNYSGDQDVNYALAMAAGAPGTEPSGLNINEVLNNNVDGLNDEIKKLLSEQGNF